MYQNSTTIIDKVICKKKIIQIQIVDILISQIQMINYYLSYENKNNFILFAFMYVL